MLNIPFYERKMDTNIGTLFEQHLLVFVLFKMFSLKLKFERKLFIYKSVRYGVRVCILHVYKHFNVEILHFYDNEVEIFKY
jgi:hypothetical protein